MRDNLVDVDDWDLSFETEKAYGLWDGESYNSQGNKSLIWVPKQFVEKDGNVFTMPEWLAMEKGLI